MSASPNLPQVRTLELGTVASGGICSLTWSPHSNRIAVGFYDHGMTLLSTDGRVLWTNHSDHHAWLRWTGDGRWLAVKRTRVCRGVVDTLSGEWGWREEGEHRGLEPGSDPAGRLLLFADEFAVRFVEAASGEAVNSLEVPSMDPNALNWSPDGTRIAVGGTGGAILVFDAKTNTLIRDCTTPESTGACFMAAWSPDSQCFAAGLGKEVLRFTRDGEPLRPVAARNQDDSIGFIDWARDGDLIAAGTLTGGRLTLVRGSTGEVLEQVVLPGGSATPVSFSPDGRLLALGRRSPCRIEVLDMSAYHVSRTGRIVGATLLKFAARQGLGVGRARSADAADRAAAQEVAEPWASMVRAAGVLHRLDSLCPLSWIVQLQRLLEPNGAADAYSLPQDKALSALAQLPGVAALRGLDWPWRARVGLLALWLEGLDLEDHRAPEGVDRAALERALGDVLSGEDVAAEPVALPRAALRGGLSGLTPGLLGLLALVGPEAMERDPGLALRLRARARGLPGFTRLPRRLLWGVREVVRAGSAQGPWQGGGESVGVQRHGELAALVTSQLALPGDLFDLRHRRGELLYRAQRAGEPPHLRPVVLVLDVSPPVYGPVERLTRPLAVWLGETLLEAGRGLGFVIAGGGGAAIPVERRETLAELWLRRSLAPAQEGQALSRAQGLCQALSGEDGLDPVIVVLSHVWFGSALEAAPSGDVRALLVHYPGQAERAPLARWCSRTVVVAPERKAAGLVPLLGELIA